MYVPGIYQIEKVMARFVGLPSCCDTGAGVDDSDRRAGDGCLAGIRDVALDSAAKFLRERNASQQGCASSRRNIAFELTVTSYRRSMYADLAFELTCPECKRGDYITVFTVRRRNSPKTI